MLTLRTKAKDNANENDHIDTNKDTLINDQVNEHNSILEAQELTTETIMSIQGTNAQTVLQGNLLCKACINSTRMRNWHSLT